jgi:uncharacterized PurR-regulated membrane protein YhhQ (DUF165 family)
MNIRNILAPVMWLYVATVVLVNLGFSYVPLISTPIGDVSLMAIVVGAVFVIRDYAQRRSGHWVLAAMTLATLLSYLMADPFVALASAAAFASSELADWLIYTVTKRPFRERVIISSLVSAPIDTAVFLLGINHFTVGTFALMILSKLVAAFVIWNYYALRPEAQPAITSEGTQAVA